MSNRELFIGAKVTLDPKSGFWRYNTESNPRGMVGRVVGVSPTGNAFLVKWSNGEENGYQQGDLKVLGTITVEDN